MCMEASLFLKIQFSSQPLANLFSLDEKSGPLFEKKLYSSFSWLIIVTVSFDSARLQSENRGHL